MRATASLRRLGLRIGVHVGPELCVISDAKWLRERTVSAYTGIDYALNRNTVSIGLGEVLRVDLTYELRTRLWNGRYLRIPDGWSRRILFSNGSRGSSVYRRLGMPAFSARSFGI